VSSYSAQLTIDTLKSGAEWQASHFKIIECDARHTLGAHEIPHRALAIAIP